MDKKMSNEEIRQFVFDERNIRNCNKCPYNIGDENCDPDRIVYPCNHSFCWVEIACDDETYIN